MSAEQVTFRNLTLLKFSPSLLSLYAESAGGSRAVPHTPEEALRASGAEAVLDGPMFEPCDPLTNVPYARQRCGDVQYKHFDLSRGVSFPTRNPTQGLTISVMPDGSTAVASGATSAAGARVAVQLYPRLVVSGQPQPVADQTFSYVAALAVMRDGRLAFVVGRNLSLPNFARQLAEAGAVYAGYTDGGGSTSLETLSGYVGHAEHRRVLTWLVARPSGGASAGASVGVIAALLALVGGVGWLWYRHATHFRGMPLPPRPRKNPIEIDTGAWRRTMDRGPELFGTKPIAPKRTTTALGYREATLLTDRLRYRGTFRDGALGSVFRVIREDRDGDAYLSRQEWTWDVRPSKPSISADDTFGRRLDLPDYMIAEALFTALKPE